ncbi:MAG: GNAT family N-acetyltransferase [Sphingobacteriales bacterium]
MVKFISSIDILNVRNIVLRDNKLTPDECRFPTDEIEGAFHLGYYEGDILATVVSLHPQNYGELTGNGYQLRGMATLAEYRGKGFGKNIVDYALNYLQQKGADYIWCNARKVASKFYRDCGFEIISNEFEIKGIGPHYVMSRKL